MNITIEDIKKEVERMIRQPFEAGKYETTKEFSVRLAEWVFNQLQPEIDRLEKELEQLKYYHNNIKKELAKQKEKNNQNPLDTIGGWLIGE